jgi:hypothetical protein
VEQAILHCDDATWQESRCADEQYNLIPGHFLRNLQVAHDLLPEASARETCALGPFREMIKRMVIKMLSFAVRTVVGSLTNVSRTTVAQKI